MESPSTERSALVAGGTERWTRRGFRLVLGTMVYNMIEAVVALWAGYRAGSIALIGFGLDSFIEITAGAVLLWRMTVQLRGAEEERVERAERRVRRFVGVTFFGLAAYVAVDSLWTLWTREAPAESLIGIALAIASLIIMPLIAFGKMRTADAMGSKALRAEAKETLACSYLSFTLLVGLVLNALAGWWWADPVAALIMVPWLIHEGKEGFEDEEKEEND
ncbi:MAG TPA: cation transporter [Syntrophobacteria bacterium]|nr:cation transporter [Syntrophobacteria bacterium]